MFVPLNPPLKSPYIILLTASFSNLYFSQLLSPQSRRSSVSLHRRRQCDDIVSFSATSDYQGLTVSFLPSLSRRPLCPLILSRLRADDLVCPAGLAPNSFTATSADLRPHRFQTLPLIFFPSPMASEEYDEVNNSCPSHSYFKNTVTLQDWWLTKTQIHDNTYKVGVAGLTFTSQQSSARRCFSSAPILKIHGIVELETVDGVSVFLQGFINKDRTLESGFSSEVFSHFVYGFPLHWEKISTSCLKRESATKRVLGEQLTLAARQEIASDEAIMTQRKSKRKLKSGSSCGQKGKGQRLTTPKSAISTSRLGLEHPI